MSTGTMHWDHPGEYGHVSIRLQSAEAPHNLPHLEVHNQHEDLRPSVASGRP